MQGWAVHADTADRSNAFRCLEVVVPESMVFTGQIYAILHLAGQYPVDINVAC
jgi:hypothetical protein